MFCTYIYSTFENGLSTEALISFFITKRFDFLNVKVCRKVMCLSFFCVIVLFLFLKFMMKKFENKISKIKLLKGIFATMTMYQQKQCYSKHQQTRSKLLINKRKQKRKQASWNLPWKEYLKYIENIIKNNIGIMLKAKFI